MTTESSPSCHDAAAAAAKASCRSYFGRPDRDSQELVSGKSDLRRTYTYAQSTPCYSRRFTAAGCWHVRPFLRPKQSIRPDEEIAGALLGASDTTSMTRLSGIYRHAPWLSTMPAQCSCAGNVVLAWKASKASLDCAAKAFSVGAPPAEGVSNRRHQSREGSSWPGRDLKGSS